MGKIEEGGVPAIAAMAPKAQQARMRVIAENIANASSTGRTAGSEPYRRQAPVFQPVKLDDGSQSVRMARVQADSSAFKQEYDPGHPSCQRSGLRPAAERRYPDRGARYEAGSAGLRGEPQRPGK